MEIPENLTQWNGQRFQGVVIACNPDIKNVPFDLMFGQCGEFYACLADDFIFITKAGNTRKESTGILIDFRNDPNTIMITPAESSRSYSSSIYRYICPYLCGKHRIFGNGITAPQR